MANDPFCDIGIIIGAQIKALDTNWRLENWSQEDLEAYCGIYNREGI